MKKLISVILALFLATGLFAACAGAPVDRPTVGSVGENAENNDGTGDGTDDDHTDDGTGGEDDAETGDTGEKDGEADETATDPYTKVIILAGQSNAYGYTYADFLKEKTEAERYERLLNESANIRIFPDADLNDCNAESIHDFKAFSLCTYPISDENGETRYRFGPEIGMAETLSRAFPNEDIYIVKVAKGGTSLYEDWRSPSRAEGTSYLYYLLVQAIQSSLNVLSEAGLNPKIAGFCWMQGESDAEKRWSEADGFAYADVWSKAYENNLEIFVNDLRETFNAYALDGETIDFIDAYINDGTNPLNGAVIWPYHETVNGAKLAFSQKDTHNHVLNTLTDDLVVQGKKGLRSDTEYTAITPIDPLHYDSTSMLKLGNMFGNYIQSICAM